MPDKFMDGTVTNIFDKVSEHSVKNTLSLTVDKFDKLQTEFKEFTDTIRTELSITEEGILRTCNYEMREIRLSLDKLTNVSIDNVYPLIKLYVYSRLTYRHCIKEFFFPSDTFSVVDFGDYVMIKLDCTAHRGRQTLKDRVTYFKTMWGYVSAYGGKHIKFGMWDNNVKCIIYSCMNDLYANQ